jgi:pimeloyl-ACP methyl ester carboxylesterase
MTKNEVFMRTSLAYDDAGGSGPLLIMLPGAGDVRSEYRHLSVDGYRVVTADLPGHGDSPIADEYTVASTADALIGLIEEIGGGPAVVVACSFAPAAAVWAATERPDLFAGIVAISPHFHSDDSLKGRFLNRLIRVMLRGPWAGKLWASLYSGWYKMSPPGDLDAQLELLRTMLSDPARRKAVRETLTAGREGVATRMESLQLPTLTIFGTADDHFADPAAESATVASQLGGTRLLVDGAGHYPHVESPEVVAAGIEAFLAQLD